MLFFESKIVPALRQPHHLRESTRTPPRRRPLQRARWAGRHRRVPSLAPRVAPSMQAYHRLIHRTLAKVPGGSVTASSPRGAFLRTLRSTTPATCGGAVLAAAVALTLVARGSLERLQRPRRRL